MINLIKNKQEILWCAQRQRRVNAGFSLPDQECSIKQAYHYELEWQLILKSNLISLISAWHVSLKRTKTVELGVCVWLCLQSVLCTCCIRFRKTNLLSVFERDNLFITNTSLFDVSFTWFHNSHGNYAVLFCFCSMHKNWLRVGLLIRAWIQWSGKFISRAQRQLAQLIEQENSFHMGKIDFHHRLSTIQNGFIVF